MENRKLVVRTRNGKSHGYWIDLKHRIKTGDWIIINSEKVKLGNRMYNFIPEVFGLFEVLEFSEEHSSFDSRSYDELLDYIEYTGKIMIRDKKIKQLYE